MVKQNTVLLFDFHRSLRVEKDYPINDYTVTHKIQDSRESYREVNAIEERYWNEFFSSPSASVEVYNKATGELLGTFNSSTRSLRLTEEQDVKELEYKFKNIKMRKSSTNDTSAFFSRQKHALIIGKVSIKTRRLVSWILERIPLLRIQITLFPSLKRLQLN